MSKSRKKDKLDESSCAYEQAQSLLKDLEEGYLTYDRIFTSIKTVKSSFHKIVGGDILEWGGHIFLWKRQAGDSLILYAQNPVHDDLKNRGLVELCRIRVPDRWVGTGRYRIDWPKERKESSSPLLLVSLYLYSTDANDLDKLILSDGLRGAYMASLFFDKENSSLFFDLAEKRFASLD